MYAIRNWLMGGMAVLSLTGIPDGSLAGNLPDTVDLDSMANLYEKVKFSHANHVMFVNDCAACHHHTTGTPVRDPDCARCHRKSEAVPVVACKRCHEARPFSAAALRERNKAAYHLDRLGLKGAYHQNCTECHNKMGGPTGCQDCHKRKKSGDAIQERGKTTRKLTG